MSPNKNYQRGRANEYKAMRILENAGYTCCRSAGSHGKFDIIAFNTTGLRLIQCKTNGNYTPLEIEALKEFKNLPPGSSKELWVFWTGKSIPTIEKFQKGSIMAKLKADEREFTSTIADDELNWHVATASLKYVNKLKKLGWVPVSTNGEYNFFEVPRRCIGFRSLKPKKMTKDHIEAIKNTRLKTLMASTVRKTEVKNGK